MKKKLNPTNNLNTAESAKDELISKLEHENQLIKQQLNEFLATKAAINESTIYDLTAQDAAKYKSLIDGSPDNILTIDLNNLIQFASLTDKSRDTSTIIGQNILEFVAEKDRETLRLCHLRAIENKAPETYEIEIINNEGEPRWYMTKVGPIIKDNSVIGLTLIARDISKRKKTEEQFAHSLSLLEATLESTADGILAADASGKIILTNKKFSKLWQMPKSVLSQNNDEIAIQFVLDQLVDPETFLSKVRELYSKPEVNSFDILHFKDGRTFERYSQAQQINGKYSGRVWSFRDVTENKKNEIALQKSQENFEQAQVLSKIGSWEHSFITGKLVWSKELKRIFELENESDDTLYESYKSRIHPEDLKLVLDTINKGLKTGKEYTIEHRIIVENAVIKHIRGIGQAVFNAEHKAIGLKGTGQDITIEHEVQEKIKQSLLEKEILLREVHHRVKNNLQIVSSILNLQAGNITDETTLNALRDSQSRIRCMALIHELIYQNQNFTLINVSEYITRISKNLNQSFLLSNNVKLRLNVGEIYLDIDISISIGLIINELLTNALKYAFPNKMEGEIAVTIAKSNNFITIIISDNGIGLPPNFDFNNTESLGMQLLVSLVSQFDGTIILDSTSGTKFEINVPLITDMH